MPKVDVKELLDAGVHFGHRTEKWNPKMKPFIFEARNGIYVINLNKTVEQIDEACAFLTKVASEGGKALFVGCKKQSQQVVKDVAERSKSFYVNERWLGGTLTNLNTIRGSVSRMKKIDEMEKNGKMRELPKTEVASLRRENARLHRNLDGIADMEKPPSALVVVDVEREAIAVREAHRLKIPVVAIADTNCNPEQVDYPIAGNDDAIRSIRVIIEALGKAVEEGSAVGAKKRTSAPKKGAPEAKKEAVKA